MSGHSLPIYQIDYCVVHVFRIKGELLFSSLLCCSRAAHDSWEINMESSFYHILSILPSESPVRCVDYVCCKCQYLSPFHVSRALSDQLNGILMVFT